MESGTAPPERAERAGERTTAPPWRPATAERRPCLALGYSSLLVRRSRGVKPSLRSLTIPGGTEKSSRAPSALRRENHLYVGLDVSGAGRVSVAGPET